MAVKTVNQLHNPYNDHCPLVFQVIDLSWALANLLPVSHSNLPKVKSPANALVRHPWGALIPRNINNTVLVHTWRTRDPVPKSHSESLLPGTTSGNLLF